MQIIKDDWISASPRIIYVLERALGLSLNASRVFIFTQFGSYYVCVIFCLILGSLYSFKDKEEKHQRDVGWNAPSGALI